MTFTASNGVRAEEVPGGVELTGTKSEATRWYSSLVEDDEVVALREYFLNERDERLGIWRSPDYPQYAIYPYDKFGEYVRVIDELTGSAYVIGRGVRDPAGPPRQVAEQYFEAHRTPKPWEDAENGDMWLISTSDLEPYVPVLYDATGKLFRYSGGGQVPAAFVTKAKLVYRKGA